MRAFMKRLDSEPEKEVFPGVWMRAVDATSMTLTEYRFTPKARFPKHVHSQEQITTVMEGSAEFEVREVAYHLDVDVVIIIPPSAPHGVTAGPQGARLLSVVCPSRSGSDGIEMKGE